ncbi:hypothetical protein C8R46DRAFT_1294520 [Mycena filopes]|nr:hypothetical protein C8R46DRAFT_1294520 [Mycena filopes]
MADAIDGRCHDTVEPMLNGLAADTPRTPNAWQRLFALFHWVNVEIAHHHPNFTAIFDQNRGEEEEEEPEEPEEETAEQKKARKAAAAHNKVLKRAQAILGRQHDDSATAEALADEIADPPVLVTEKAEDAALSTVVQGFASPADDDWKPIFKPLTARSSPDAMKFLRLSSQLDADTDYPRRDQTIKSAREWAQLTGPGSGNAKHRINAALFQDENAAIFRNPSEAATRAKMKEYSAELKLFKQHREQLITACNRLDFAFNLKNFGSGVLVHPFTPRNLDVRVPHVQITRRALLTTMAFYGGFPSTASPNDPPPIQLSPEQYAAFQQFQYAQQFMPRPPHLPPAPAPHIPPQVSIIDPRFHTPAHVDNTAGRIAALERSYLSGILSLSHPQVHFTRADLFAFGKTNFRSWRRKWKGKDDADVAARQTRQASKDRRVMRRKELKSNRLGAVKQYKKTNDNKNPACILETDWMTDAISQLDTKDEAKKDDHKKSLREAAHLEPDDRQPVWELVRPVFQSAECIEVKAELDDIVKAQKAKLKKAPRASAIRVSLGNTKSDTSSLLGQFLQQNQHTDPKARHTVIKPDTSLLSDTFPWCYIMGAD